jgi:putative transposase
MSPSVAIAASQRLYRRLIATAARRDGAEIWAYCLMPNHVHLIVTPAGGDGLRATFAEAYRRYTGTINARFRWTGYLIQGRFGAVVMDEPHLPAAARYIVPNPVVAGLVNRAEDWPWSSARAHLAGEDDELARVTPLRALVPDFAALLAAPADRRRRPGSSAGPPSDDCWGRRNGWRSLSAGSGAHWRPVSPGQNPEWSRPSHAKPDCCDALYINCHRNS